jgi:NitT/TauT family transport system permease protein
MAAHRTWLRLVALGIIAVGIATAILFPSAAGQGGYVLSLALFSTTRMLLAFILSLIFAIAYGTAAAVSRRATGILIPILDILQSVPILGFFPLVLVFFGQTLPYPFGVETAIIVLIFTSMAWNMAFGVYEALTTLPHDLLDATSAFGLKGWVKFRRLQLPATIPKLVYNSILSWTVGWFYLVASEVFTAFGRSYARPGIGSYIYYAGVDGNVPAVLVGLAALVLVVILLDTFAWRPLSTWSERFRMDVVSAGESARPAPAYIRLSWLPRFPGIRRTVGRVMQPVARRWERVASRLDEFYTRHAWITKTVRRVDLALFFAILILLLVGIASLVTTWLQRPLPSGATEIPLAALGSLGRMTLAYVIALAWTIPVAAWMGRSKRASKVLTPVIEVVASVPATALFPLIILFAVAVASGTGAQSEVAALVIIIFAMQWYLLFNLLAGVRGIPADLNEAAEVFGLHGWEYWKQVLLPAVMPSLLTGSITAWGAGWNALIVAEFIQFGGTTFQVGAGLGSILDVATYGGILSGQSVAASNALLALAVLALVLVVLLLNKLLWRPLIKWASTKYRVEFG